MCVSAGERFQGVNVVRQREREREREREKFIDNQIDD